MSFNKDIYLGKNSKNRKEIFSGKDLFSQALRYDTEYKSMFILTEYKSLKI